MASHKKSSLYKSIAYFLRKEVEEGSHSAEVTESLEVAKQCLESAFGFSTDQHGTVPDLFKIFSTSVQTPSSPERPVSQESKAMAESLKNQGNFCMKENKFQEAIACYTKAIELSPQNAVYYSNRAAAYSRLDQQHKAIEDCRSALNIDPGYSKAYGRMGIAYSSLGDYAQAITAYRKGLELDPSNETCQQNLSLVEERLRDSSTAGAPATGSPASGLGAFDLGSILNNPMMQNLACQLMQDPNTQNVMADMFRSTFTGAQPTPDTNTANVGATPTATNGHASVPASGASGQNMDQLLRMGQQIAEQLRSTNPQLVDQLRQTFQNSPQSDAPGSTGRPA